MICFYGYDFICFELRNNLHGLFTAKEFYLLKNNSYAIQAIVG